MKIQSLLFTSIIGLGSLPFTTQADIAPSPMSGGISLEAPGSSQTEIALLHNTVKMQISPTLCKTRAFFRLRNTGKATDLEVGFPLIYKVEAADFKVFVDNKPVVFVDKEKQGRTPIGQPFTRWWKVWQMKFDPEETHLVEVRYSNAPERGWSPKLSDSFGVYPWFHEWLTTGRDYNLGDYGYKERVELHEWVEIKTVRYILITGSYWKGPIERCRVEADIGNVATDSIVEVQPPAKSFSSKQLVWEWKNVEPARNVALTFVGGLSPRQMIIPYLRKIAAQNHQDEKLQDTLGKIERDFADDGQTRARQKAFVQP